MSDDDPWIPDELRTIAETVKAHPGADSKPARTVRDLLAWFGNRGRGHNVNLRIQKAVTHAGLQTQPDFRSMRLDNVVEFHPIGEVARIDLDDPTTRVSRLLTADLRPTEAEHPHGLAYLKPEDSIDKATSLMLLNGFSQIPVLKGNRRDIRGVISWKSIGARVALGHDLSPDAPVHRALDPVGPPIRLTDSILRAARRVADEDFVLVVDHDRGDEVTGIVTAADLTDLFRDLSGAFILLGEIELHLRTLLDGRFVTDELAAVRRGSEADTEEDLRISDLSFGDIQALLAEDEHWDRLRLPIDRKLFVGRLNTVREIRNAVLHFDLDRLEDGDLRPLETLSHVLRTIRDLLPVGANAPSEKA